MHYRPLLINGEQTSGFKGFYTLSRFATISKRSSAEPSVQKLATRLTRPADRFSAPTIQAELVCTCGPIAQW